jgi:hypothetical protein
MTTSEALHRALDAEIQSALATFRAGDHERAFYHLERAHILSQRFTLRHMQVHWAMLKHGATLKMPREVVGQAVRIVAAALFSRIWVPIGNTGRANVSALRPMPIPEDLRYLFEESAKQSQR